MACVQVGGPCATWFGHLLGTAVYIAATICFLHTNGRTLTSLAINVRLRRRLLWLRVSVSGLLIAVWNTNDAQADLDGSGTVDSADLGLLIAAWGLCP